MNMRDSFPVIFRYFDLQGDIVVAPLYLKLLENVFVCKTKNVWLRNYKVMNRLLADHFFFFSTSMWDSP